MDINIQNIIQDRFTFMKDVYIECGDGWSGLLYGLCTHLEQHYIKEKANLNDIKVLQVKEKYGGLRFYTGELIDSAYNIIDLYEDISYNIDEHTGLPKKEV